ncbi:dTDP-4-dehydrorhamnose reductase [Cnuella takakiae]|uniref:dTDP-4-dehydrorhamnose reductase n=2 Tax=Cnuella takakiae TaxID=1302690 RepID=A0A1M4SZA2_9BACT|nr:dTDP-4-dehydrorhamnose reductase [Cnuella takakiae]
MNRNSAIEIWGGMECTINRVQEDYFDQSEYAGHYNRGKADIDLVASLGVNMLRYPVLWERHQPIAGQVINWSFAEGVLVHMKASGIEPIAGLVHHGSGPRHVNFFDGSFEQGLAAYAKEVATQFPWLEYYTPVNEPLTTARFCGLYGHWYPHGQSDYTFYKVLLSECKATIMAMEVIRQVNPDAKLVQTEDLGKCYSTPLLQYQAEFENQRRWLSYDLLCGRVDEQHFMWPWLLKAGITAEELQFFKAHSCVPHIAGFNYYITSERYLDEDLSKYPEQYHGGNYRHRYADIETVKVHLHEPNGPALLLKEAWAHLQLPIAITECHLHSTREDQMRWFHTMWQTANKVKAEGVDIRAITAWAIFGLYGWNCLVTKPCGDYEPGVFNLSSGCPKPTALTRLLQELTQHQVYYHPVLEHEGWWQRENRHRYGTPAKVVRMRRKQAPKTCRPLLVLGRETALRQAFEKICVERNIHHLLLDTADMDRTDQDKMEQLLREIHPWGLIDATDDACTARAAGTMPASHFGPAVLAAICGGQHIPYLFFSTDAVASEGKQVKHEKLVLQQNESALIIRSTGLFGPWDQHNYVTSWLNRLRSAQPIAVPAEQLLAPTYIPHLVHACIDLLLDGAQGIYPVNNGETTSMAAFARRIALMAGLDENLVCSLLQQPEQKDTRALFHSASITEQGVRLPSLAAALEQYLEAQDHLYHSGKMVG